MNFTPPIDTSRVTLRGEFDPDFSPQAMLVKDSLKNWRRHGCQELWENETKQAY